MDKPPQQAVLPRAVTRGSHLSSNFPGRVVICQCRSREPLTGLAKWVTELAHFIRLRSSIGEELERGWLAAPLQSLKPLQQPLHRGWARQSVTLHPPSFQQTRSYEHGRNLAPERKMALGRRVCLHSSLGPPGPLPDGQDAKSLRFLETSRQHGSPGMEPHHHPLVCSGGDYTTAYPGTWARNLVRIYSWEHARAGGCLVNMSYKTRSRPLDFSN
jgi:hypothetical protein